MANLWGKIVLVFLMDDKNGDDNGEDEGVDEHDEDFVIMMMDVVDMLLKGSYRRTRYTTDATKGDYKGCQIHIPKNDKIFRKKLQ